MTNHDDWRERAKVVEDASMRPGYDVAARAIRLGIASNYRLRILTELETELVEEGEG